VRLGLLQCLAGILSFRMGNKLPFRTPLLTEQKVGPWSPDNEFDELSENLCDNDRGSFV